MSKNSCLCILGRLSFYFFTKMIEMCGIYHKVYCFKDSLGFKSLQSIRLIDDSLVFFYLLSLVLVKLL